MIRTECVYRGYMSDFAGNGTIVAFKAKLDEALAEIPEQYRDEAMLDIDDEDGHVMCEIYYERLPTPEEHSDEQAERKARADDDKRQKLFRFFQLKKELGL